MKSAILIACFLCAGVMASAQVSKTVTVTAGGLSTTLSKDELKTITNLTINGTLDARDFRIMCDSMVALTVLDLSNSQIEAYSGSDRYGDIINYPENTLPESAFEDNETLTSIILPSTITSIGAWAFDWATSLQSVTLPKGLIEIGEEAFDYCISLKEISIPASTNTINSGAFRRSSGKILVDDANEYFSSIDGVLLDKQKTTIIFCPVSVAGKYVVPSSVTSIANDAFDDCMKITAIEIPPTVTKIGVEAFYDCTGLQSVILPKSLKKIEHTSFKNCKGLSSIVIPEAVDTIEQAAFQGCTGLVTLTIPNSVKSIDNWAFASCENMQSIYSFIEKPFNFYGSMTYNPFNDINKTTCTLFVPTGTKSAYKALRVWGDFQNIVEMYLSLSTSQVSFSNAGEDSAKVTITTNAPYWKAYSDQSWLSISPSSGESSDIITLTAQVNTSNTLRQANVTVVADGIGSQKIAILQNAGKSGFSTITDHRVQIFPNPVKEDFRITGIIGKSTITISDLFGKIRLCRDIIDDETLSIDNLEKGVYVISITTNKQTIEKKFIKL